ncbi:MAG TPA: hypothetical protein VFE23_15735 [Usitatibacter sp.]|jgi:hypothetical protein|nr:hypothetical protein [Usitatibacter sp.]
MKATTIALALGITLCGAAAWAEDNDTNYPFDPRWAAQEQQREAWINEQRAEQYDPARAAERGAVPAWGARGGLSERDECWNPHAGHFEGVRPGERQDDLDFSRCRPKQEYARHHHSR